MLVLQLPNTKILSFFIIPVCDLNPIEPPFVVLTLFAELKLGSVLDAAKSSIFECVACNDDVIESIDSLVFGMIETVFDCTLPVSVGVKIEAVEFSRATIK